MGIRILGAAEAEQEREALAEILHDCVDGGASVGFLQPYSVADASRWWSGVIGGIDAGRTVLFGAYEEGRLSGTVQLGLDTPPNQRHRADVNKLLVHRRARGRGLARRLMQALEDEARARSRNLLTLDTATGSVAETLYAALGWHRSGSIPGFALLPDGTACATTIFWKAL